MLVNRNNLRRRRTGPGTIGTVTAPTTPGKSTSIRTDRTFRVAVGLDRRRAQPGREAAQDRRVFDLTLRAGADGELGRQGHRDLFHATSTNTGLVEIQRPPRGVHHSDHESGSRAPTACVGTGDDPGTSVTYYDYPAELARPRVRGHDAGQRSQRRSGFQDHRSGRASNGSPRAGSSLRPTRPRSSTSRSVQQQQGRRTAQAARCAMNPNAEIIASNNTWEWVGQDVGRVYLPVRHSGVGELRGPERDCRRPGRCSSPEARRFGRSC